LQKNIVTFGELFLKPSSTIRPESTMQFNVRITLKYCRQLLIMSMLEVLNTFIRKRTITKSTDERSDFSNGQASKPYRRTGINLLFKSCNTTSSDAIRPTFPNMVLDRRHFYRTSNFTDCGVAPRHRLGSKSSMN